MKAYFQGIILGITLLASQYCFGQATVSLPDRVIVKMLPDSSRAKVYALNRGDGISAGTLLALNSTNGSILNEIAVGVMPTDMVATLAGDALYVINTGSRTLMKVDLPSLSVTATRTISTPNAYSASNPLYLAAGRSNVVHFTDGGGVPGVYTFDFLNGTNIAFLNDGDGAGGLATTRDGKTLYSWRQYGWGAGSVDSWLTRYDAQAATLAPLETSFVSWRRDPLDTPILLNWAETLVFNKQQAFVATNVSVLVQSFSENLYAITRDGSIAFGNTRVFVSATGLELGTLPFSSTLQVVAGNQLSLFRYRNSPSELVVYPLADILGAGWETNLPPVAGYVRTPTNASTLTTITFNGSLSSDDQGGGSALEYRWDWENDGTYDTAFTNQPVATYRYNIAGTKTAALQVKDRYGATSVTLQTFNVVQQDDPGLPGGGNPQFEVQFAGADVVFDPVRHYAYVSGYANKTLVMLNLTNGLIERQFNFDWNPESITVSPNGEKMYVALLKRPHSHYWFGGHTNYIAEFDLTQRVKTKEFEILADPYDLAVTDSGILVVPGGSDQWTDIQTYRTATGQLLGTSGIRQMSRVSLHPSQQAVYTADADLSPSDIRRYDFNPTTGIFAGTWDSPYHGNYPMSGNVWCQPGGTNVIVRGGGVFSSSPVQAQDMLYQRTLAGGSVEGAAFDPAHNAFFTVGNSLLRYYNLKTYELVLSQTISNAPQYIQAGSNHLFVAWMDGNRTVFQRFPNPAVGAETNQPPVAGYVRTTTNATTLTTITFNGSLSSDDQGGGSALEYRWDWENDGTYDTAFTNQPVATYRYNIAGTKTAALQVKDRYGATSVTLQTFNVVQQDDPGLPGGGNPQFEVQFAGADVVFDPVRPYAYVSGYANKTLVVLNLTNGLIERQFNFDWNPESITVSPNGEKMYVALLKRPHSYYWFGGHTNYIAEFDLTQRVKTKEFEILADPYDLAVTDSGILVVPGGSDQWTDIRTYRTATGQLLGTSGIRQMSRVSLHPSQQAVYTADTDSSPSDIRRYDFNPTTGIFAGTWDSPYHGNYPMSGNVWCQPGGTNVIVRGGGVFSSSPVQAQDMLYQRTLAGGSVEGAAFDPAHNAFFTVGASGSSTWLRQYALTNYQLIYSQEITNGSRYVHVSNRDVYVAWATGDRTSFQKIQNPALPDAVITLQPKSQTNVVGGTVTFNVGVRGESPITYQWYFQNSPLTAETNQFLVRNNLQAAQAGDYHVTVSNAFATVTSTVAQLVILVPPSIVQQPQSLLAPAGSIATLSVEAVGSSILRYQWSMDSINIFGATNASYSITNVQMGQVGTYRVAVQNSVGSVSSDSAMLRVLPTVPNISTNPASQMIPAGNDLLLNVAFTGVAPIGCQWLFNGEPLSGATSATLLVTNLQSANSGYYTARLSNSVGQTFSDPAVVTVTPSSPWFVIHPIGKSVSVRTVITLKSEARGSSPLSYQWRKNSASLPGATNASLVLNYTNAVIADAYDVIALNPGGSVTSLVAMITVTGMPPVFVQQPASATVLNGGTLILSSSATGTAPMGYRWYFNGAELPGQIAAQLVSTNVSAAATGAYFVLASNAYGQATSSIANVTVLLPPQWLTTLTNQMVMAGTDAVLAVTAQGAAPLKFFWSHNGMSCPQVTNGILSLTNIQPDQAGAYRVVVSNALGMAVSTMTLAVFNPPGAVLAWGDNTGGQTNVPADLADVVATAGGDFHSAALRLNGTVRVWGFNGNGQISIPQGLSNVVAIAAGSYHSLALKLNGQVVAWGFNASGQTAVPANLGPVIAIAAGESHSVAVRQDGSIIAWGDNTLGQRNVPANPGFITTLASGRNHTLALRNNGTVIAWGQNSHGQTSVPTGLSDVRAIAAGYLHSLVLNSTGKVIAWGDNTYGQTAVPSGLSNVVAVAAGDFHSYALKADGNVVSWGGNDFGQQDIPPLLHHVQFLGSGCYHGVATVAPMLNYMPTLNAMLFSWVGPYVLEYSPTLNGPFTLSAATSPCTNQCMNPVGFFRLKRSE